MSDFKQTSLHEELEVRVIALLTGELSNAEADELEKVLAINEELSAFRDRMAALMGELHDASDELAAPEGEAPRELSAERRASIFGDASVLEPARRRKRFRPNPAFWGIAASIVMVFMIGILGSIQFKSESLREESMFEAASSATEPLPEQEYHADMQQRIRSMPPPPPKPQAIAVNEPYELDIPSLDLNLRVDSSPVVARSGVERSGRESIPVESPQADYAKVGETIPVEIPSVLMEGTPQPIRVPNLEPAPTEAPRMVVVARARESAAREERPDVVSLSGAREVSLSLSAFGYAGDRSEKEKSNVDPFAAAPATTEPMEHAERGQTASADGFALSQPTDSFAAQAAKVRLSPKPEKLAAEEPFSTFSLNISDVSFKLAQAALENFRVPPSAQIRTEEFVNSFDYGDPAPRPDQPVALHWEMAQHPFEHNRQVVRFSLQTQASGRASEQPLNLTLLIDSSGSMQRRDRQAILRNSLQTLQEKLTDQDQLNVVLFARQPRLIAEAQTRSEQRAAVESALAYRPEGGTNLEAGLYAAYESARRHYRPDGNNRVILMTDGAANLGNVNPRELAQYVIEQRKQGIALDAYGIGWDDYNDALLEEITRNGDGRYAFLNSVEAASADFAERLAGTLRVAAADVKVQIEWNPDRVQRYRQIGYDLHQLNKEDFRDNTVDAAEIGEAESGTALYVLKINDDPEIFGGLGTFRVRYLDPATGVYREHSWPLPMPFRVPEVHDATPSIRLAMSSAFFGERLADNPHAAGYSFRDLYNLTSGLSEAFPRQPRVTQLQAMLLRANELFEENK